MNIVLLDLHPFKIINGSLFYALEYTHKLVSCGVDSELVIHIPSDPEITTQTILSVFEEKYSCYWVGECLVFNTYNVKIHFLTRKVDVLKKSYKANSILFVDVYSFENFRHSPKPKFVFSNEYYEYQFNKLPDNCKSSTKFYGYYDYQYHSKDCKAPLMINFDIFRDILKTDNLDYVHLTDPNKFNLSYIKETVSLDEFLVKLPSKPIKNLFSKIKTIHYCQNSDVIDKNNRSLLEAQYYDIDILYYDCVSSERTISNINRLKSRVYDEFTLSKDNKLIKDIIIYEKSCNT